MPGAPPALSVVPETGVVSKKLCVIGRSRKQVGEPKVCRREVTEGICSAFRAELFKSKRLKSKIKASR